ncbi:hypothetical protein BKA70DRAFT_1215987 [Coprinopsis sp. MPI-PUGE-AT-0042]|nr:hypothetical protein BKA70DRAFT_1215987 [Coprinopsis sp. MPI-PUGE-AT-0042]
MTHSQSYKCSSIMRPFGIFSLLTATLLATSGVFAYYDDEYTGGLTARDVFEDDVLQERSFDDIDEYDARDYLDDEYDARDFFDDEDELAARVSLSKAAARAVLRVPFRTHPGPRGQRKKGSVFGNSAGRRARTKILAQNPDPPQGNSVSAREFLEELLEARDQAEQAAARRRRRQRQRLRKAGKRKSKKLKADPSAQAAPAGAPAADAAAPAPAAAYIHAQAQNPFCCSEPLYWLGDGSPTRILSSASHIEVAIRLRFPGSMITRVKVVNCGEYSSSYLPSGMMTRSHPQGLVDANEDGVVHVNCQWTLIASLNLLSGLHCVIAKKKVVLDKKVVSSE